jgi:hypothetical protein
MPVSGTGSYSGIIDGYGIGATSAYTVAGTSSFSVNFATGSLVGSLSPVGTNVSTGATNNFGNFAFSGSVGSGATFTGDITSSYSSFKGQINGGFFGPGAAELVGIFGNLRVTDPADSASFIQLQGLVAAKKGP